MKRKLQRFMEMETFANVIQSGRVFPPINHEIRGCWNKVFFRNTNPVVLELGCGRGEYTLALAEKYPHKNFIGVDIKGARLWKGCKTALERNLHNAGFLRIMIEHLEYFFAPGEVSEIWITFPDPQLQRSYEKKRLTSPKFLDRYKAILAPQGLVHLKTDNVPFFDYTLNVLRARKYSVLQSSSDLYASEIQDEILCVKTTYEKIFLAQGVTICYAKFMLE